MKLIACNDKSQLPNHSCYYTFNINTSGNPIVDRKSATLVLHQAALDGFSLREVHVYNKDTPNLPPHVFAPFRYYFMGPSV